MKMNNALKMQACNCKQRKPNKEKQFQSRIAEELKTLDPFNKVRLLLLFTNLLLSLSLFFVLCLFLNPQFLIGHRLAVLDSIIKIQNSLHLPPISLNSGSLWNTCWSLAIVVSPLSSLVSHHESLPGDSQSSHHHPEAVTFGSPN